MRTSGHFMLGCGDIRKVLGRDGKVFLRFALSAIAGEWQMEFTETHREQRRSREDTIMTTSGYERSAISALMGGSVHRAGRTDVSQRDLRDSMAHYASGLTIVTGFDLDGPVGFTCQSFYSVSLDPPLISFSVMTSSSSYPRIRDTGRFCVNILAHNQHELSNQFARRGTDKWAGTEWGITTAGTPVLRGTLLWIDCELRDEYEAGDHYIVVGEVKELSPGDWNRGEPLVFFKGSYRTLQRREWWPQRPWVLDE